MKEQVNVGDSCVAGCKKGLWGIVAGLSGTVDEVEYVRVTGKFRSSGRIRALTYSRGLRWLGDGGIFSLLILI